MLLLLSDCLVDTIPSSTRCSADSVHKSGAPNPALVEDTTRPFQHGDDDVIPYTNNHIATRARLLADVADFASLYGLEIHLAVLENGALLTLQRDGDTIAETSDLDLTPAEHAALEAETTSPWHQPRMLYFIVVTCSLGAVMQGWSQTGSNGATLGFPVAFDVAGHTLREEIIVGAINSAPFLCLAVLGAWLATPVNDALGRRGAISAGALITFLAVIASGLSQNWPQLLFARLVLGLGMGLNASTTPVYAAECAPAAIRGGLSVSWQMFTAFGVFLGFCANLAMINYGVMAWRLQLASAFIPTLPLLVAIYSCPESPAWHVKANNDYAAAFASLCRLRNSELQAARDVYYLYMQQRISQKLDASPPSFVRQLSELFTIPRNRRAALAAGTVMFAQQLCGINIIAFYSSTIFSTAGLSTFIALSASCVFGAVNTIFALPAVYAMDKYGRRSLLLYAFPPMAVCMAAMALCFQIPIESMWYLPSLSLFVRPLSFPSSHIPPLPLPTLSPQSLITNTPSSSSSSSQPSTPPAPVPSPSPTPPKSSPSRTAVSECPFPCPPSPSSPPSSPSPSPCSSAPWAPAAPLQYMPWAMLGLGRRRGCLCPK